jgi:L-asparaginase/Glu-tRNA(Gln) amidotransferase subunit D
METYSSADVLSLEAYAKTLKDPSLKCYEELRADLFDQGRLARFKETLRTEYRKGFLNLTIIGTGGTFQSAKTDHGIEPTGSLDQSFRAMRLPYNKNEVKFHLFELFNYDSAKLRTGDHIRIIADVLIDLLRECPDVIDGFIITHGTDTMTETANYLSLILGRGLKKSIIITGSQEPARMRNTDATNNMDNAMKIHQFFADENIGAAEVMVLCGNELVRGAWTQKETDKDSDAFKAYNKRPLLRVDNRLVKTWKDALAPFILKARPDVPFLPFNGVTTPADISIEKLADISEERVAKLLQENRMGVFGLLGSSTCPNTHGELLAHASRNRKPIGLQIPFHDAVLVPGTYEAGAVLANAGIPLVKGTQSFIKAKLNWLWHYLGIETESVEGFGEVIKNRHQQDQLYALLCQNMIGEWD